MVEDSEGDLRFPISSLAGDSDALDVEGLGMGSCIRAVSTAALVATEYDITPCGRVETELVVFFKFFTRRSIESPEFDVWAFVRDPEAGVDGVDRRLTCVEATRFCGVCDSTGTEVLEGVVCPCRSGTTAGETLRDKVNDRVSDTRRTYV